ncbi:MAG: hypothetical protein LBL09_04360 [Oscillospiraceae bacterium]|jgi:hypothetical protein|nr:hypothetical protein [Oscillospiraceae bacterium]
MLNLLRVELSRSVRRTSVLIALIFVVIFGCMLIYPSNAYASLTQKSAYTDSMNKGNMTEDEFYERMNEDFRRNYASTAMSSMGLLGFLSVACVVPFAVKSDFTKRRVAEQAAIGYGRFSMLAAKLLSLWIVCFAVFLIGLTVSYLTSPGVWWGYVSAADIPLILQYILLDAAIVAVLASVCMVGGYIFRGSVLSVIFSLALYLAVLVAFASMSGTTGLADGAPAVFLLCSCALIPVSLAVSWLAYRKADL